jgi:DNA (cytosine-5)-methyltransferase 1
VKSIELFAGAGGLGLGADLAGLKPQLIVERDKWCCETLSANRKGALKLWPETAQLDIHNVDFKPWENQIDVVTGGPPCQPFSLGGKHRANEDQRDMWSQAVRSVREIRPKAFIFENVKGLTRSSFSTYFSYIYLQLSYPDIAQKLDETWSDHLARLEQHHSSGPLGGLQYQVIPPRVLNAADYGVPQKRERVFFIGFRNDLGANWAFPKATHSLDSLQRDQSVLGSYWDLHRLSRDKRTPQPTKKNFDPSLLPWMTVRDALVGLPNPELANEKPHTILNHRFQPGAKTYAGHTGSPLDLPAKTLKAGVHGVPGGENMMVRDDGSVRYFTIRESARLQTFPDNFTFSGSWSESMRQLGNAVPVDLAHIMAASVVNHIKLLTTAGHA